MTRHRGLELLSDAAITEAIARTPLDHYILWDGSTCGAQQGSLRSRALAMVEEVLTPIPLRTLIQRAARITDCDGLDPAQVRSAVRLHQAARPAAYLLVRKTLNGDYLAVTDIPWPAASQRPIREGQVVLSREGYFLASEGQAPPEAPSRALRYGGQSARSW